MSSRQQQQQQQQQQQANAQSQQPLANMMQPTVITPAIAATNIVKSRIDFVQVDALVLLKIVKHCHEMGGGAESSQGFLTGLVYEQEGANKPKRIEVTNCFAVPNTSTLGSAVPKEEESGYDKWLNDNIKNLRQLNIDNLIVGWYQSSLFGTFMNKDFIESQFNYQEEIEDSIVLIYDPFKSQNGSLLLKAYRLLPNMIELLRKKEFTPEIVRELKLNHENFIEELPLVIKNSHLQNAMLCEMQEMPPYIPNKSYNFLDLSTSNVLEKNIKSLIDNVDELSAETTKYLNNFKAVQKANHQKQLAMQKREAENSARRARGEPPLPEEDYTKFYKNVTPITRLEALVVSNQIKNYCQQINEFTSQAFSNLFIAEALQNK